MDAEAARAGRQKRIQWDLLKATTDEEACPPVWLDLLGEVRDEASELRDRLDREIERFATEPDIRTALARRERLDREVRERTEKINRKVRRLNLLAPLPRFQRRGLDPDELLRPLYRTRRRAV